ncbi:MAG: hypothetical protein WAK26_13010, partial [Terracidiphilus sp.]
MESTRLPFLSFEDSHDEYRPLALDYWNGNVVEGRFRWAASVEEISDAQRGIIADMCQRNQTFRYDDIGYLDAVIAFSIMLASDEACEHGTFQQSDGLHLCASTALSSKLLARLFNAGILGIQKTTPWQTIELNNEA